MVLNIYPLERSLEKLASMFGAVSSNRDDVNVFVTMLKSLRLTFDHEELVGNRQLHSYVCSFLECTHNILLIRLQIEKQNKNRTLQTTVALREALQEDYVTVLHVKLHKSELFQDDC